MLGMWSNLKERKAERRESYICGLRLPWVTGDIGGQETAYGVYHCVALPFLALRSSLIMGLSLIPPSSRPPGQHRVPGHTHSLFWGSMRGGLDLGRLSGGVCKAKTVSMIILRYYLLFHSYSHISVQGS